MPADRRIAADVATFIRMLWPYQSKALARYWLRVLAFYALTEGCIQLLFYFILNNFRESPITNIEFHVIMWLFQCVFILPIWWVAHAMYKQSILAQVVVHIVFFILYSYAWFYLVQDVIQSLHQSVQLATRNPSDRLPSAVDTVSNLNYQFIKHAFRLSWFFLANYFYHYKGEEQKRRKLAMNNKELELKLLTWQLNPSFYFNAIEHLQQLAAVEPAKCTTPILQLARVMEYVIYETKEPKIPVSKELFFLNSYIDLVNQHGQSKTTFALSTVGKFDNLRISPLLLVGFIDKLLARNAPGSKYRLNLEFSGESLFFHIVNCSAKHTPFITHENDELYRRMSEVYAGRFTMKQKADQEILELKLVLDEQN